MVYCLAPRLSLLAVLHAHVTGIKELTSATRSPARGGTTKRSAVNISVVTKTDKKTYRKLGLR